MYVIRALGGALFVLGALVMVYNIYMTIRSPKTALIGSQAALVPGE
jgi:cytochrome c oxidase cbb3-type subunit 1